MDDIEFELPMPFYTYAEMSKIFRVSITTIRNWKWKGKFKVMGYRPLGGWAREALVSSAEIKRLIKKHYIDPWK